MTWKYVLFMAGWCDRQKRQLLPMPYSNDGQKGQLLLLNESDSDLIISTFKLPDEVQIPYLITKHYPSISDVQRIQTMVEELLDEKAVFALTERKNAGK